MENAHAEVRGRAADDDAFAVLEQPAEFARRPVRQVAYHFLPQSVQADLHDKAACEHWRWRAARALRAIFPFAEVTVSYQLDVPGCHQWLDVDGNLRPTARALALGRLDAEFTCLTLELEQRTQA